MKTLAFAVLMIGISALIASLVNQRQNRRIAALETALARQARDLATAGELLRDLRRNHGDALAAHDAILRELCRRSGAGDCLCHATPERTR